MVRYSLIAMAGLVCALPLNINLGAYSPALVVGDGEIKLSGAKEAAQPAPVVPAPAPTRVQPGAPVATAGAGNPALQEQAQQIGALQGMGKEIAPRIRERDSPDEDHTHAVAKRQLQGFDRALTYAEAALVKGPKIQLGTGGAAGIGIIVDNNQVAAARPGNGEAGKRKKRDGASTGPKVMRVTTMYVRSGIPNSLKSGSVNRDVIPAPLPAASNFKRVALPEILTRSSPSAPGEALDSVNLNVDGDQGITMTFVESVEEDEDDGVDEDVRRAVVV